MVLRWKMSLTLLSMVILYGQRLNEPLCNECIRQIPSQFECPQRAFDEVFQMLLQHKLCQLHWPTPIIIIEFQTFTKRPEKLLCIQRHFSNIFHFRQNSFFIQNVSHRSISIFARKKVFFNTLEENFWGHY